jgi:putative transposase
VANVGTKLQLRPGDGPVRWRKPRLDRSAYTGQRTYHIALVTAQRIPFFEFCTDARPCEVALRDAADRLQFDLLAYCFMPDHLHVLLKGQKPSSDLLRFVQRFKQVTGFQFKRDSGQRLWQQSFYDRVLRRGEDPLHVAAYIFGNPLSAGVPAASAAYELRGGAYYEEHTSDGAKASSLRSGSRDEAEA